TCGRICALTSPSSVAIHSLPTATRSGETWTIETVGGAGVSAGWACPWLHAVAPARMAPRPKRIRKVISCTTASPDPGADGARIARFGPDFAQTPSAGADRRFTEWASRATV